MTNTTTPPLFLLIHDNKQHAKRDVYYLFLPQQYLYFLPLPHGHGSFRPIFGPFTTVPDFFCSLYNSFLFSSEKILFHWGSSYSQSAFASTMFLYRVSRS